MGTQRGCVSDTPKTCQVQIKISTVAKNLKTELMANDISINHVFPLVFQSKCLIDTIYMLRKLERMVIFLILKETGSYRVVYVHTFHCNTICISNIYGAIFSSFQNAL